MLQYIFSGGLIPLIARLRRNMILPAHGGQISHRLVLIYCRMCSRIKAIKSLIRICWAHLHNNRLMFPTQPLLLGARGEDEISIGQSIANTII